MRGYMWDRSRAAQLGITMACGVLGTACMMAEGVADGEGASAGANPDSELASALGEGTALTVSGSEDAHHGSLIQVEAAPKREDRLAHQSLHSLDLEVLGGYLDARAVDDQEVVEVDDLTIDIGDIDLPTEVISADVSFTGIQARLAHPTAAPLEWDESGASAEASASLDLVVDWGVSVDGGDMHPLAPVEVESLDIILEISANDDGHPVVELAGFRDGVFYEWAGLVELGGLSLDVRAGHKGA